MENIKHGDGSLDALTRRKCWVQDVNIDADVDFRIPDPVFKLFDDASHPDTIDIPGFDHVKAAADIVSYVPSSP